MIIQMDLTTALHILLGQLDPEYFIRADKLINRLVYFIDTCGDF